MANHVLQLNADYTPQKLIRWERAIELILDGKATLVESTEGRFVRSARLALPWPAVIALKKYSINRGKVRFHQRSVIARDNYTCQYCGIHDSAGRLTMDHVIPRAQAKDNRVYLPWSKKWVSISCWENCVAACKSCNSNKADRTPAQANMKLGTIPRIPTSADTVRIMLGRIKSVPSEWMTYLPDSWKFEHDSETDEKASISR